MRCDGCGLDKTATVVRSFTCTRYPPHGGPVTETRTSRLCVACGGGDAPEVLAPIADRARR
jgi:hypothetical protein